MSASLRRTADARHGTLDRAVERPHVPRPADEVEALAVQPYAFLGGRHQPAQRLAVLAARLGHRGDGAGELGMAELPRNAQGTAQVEMPNPEAIDPRHRRDG